MARVVILSGPEGCGKSELVQHLKIMVNDIPILEARCKDELYKATAEFFDVPMDVFMATYSVRLLKEYPLSLFTLREDQVDDLAAELGTTKEKLNVYEHSKGVWFISLRLAMIYVSECVVKVERSVDYFGICRAKRVKELLKQHPNAVIFDDSALGKMYEILPLVEPDIGLIPADITVVKITGRGEFSVGDSRKYINKSEFLIDLPGASYVELENTGTLEEFLFKAEKLFNTELAWSKYPIEEIYGGKS